MRAWVDEDASQREFRRVVHTILVAIAGSDILREEMIMKGGMLLAIAYSSTRFTRDIDFSTERYLKEFDQDAFIAEFEQSLVRAIEHLQYGIDCRLQTFHQNPPGKDRNFPTMQMTIGYAQQGDSRRYRHLLAGNAIDVVTIDHSLNERIRKTTVIEVDDGVGVVCYSITDLISEKLRAILQQSVRNRSRRQDIYDLFVILESEKSLTYGQDVQAEVLISLLEKAESRNLYPTKMSLRDEEIRRRSQEQYADLQEEIGEALPPFEATYDLVRSYYEHLPWDTS